MLLLDQPAHRIPDDMAQRMPGQVCHGARTQSGNRQIESGADGLDRRDQFDLDQSLLVLQHVELEQRDRPHRDDAAEPRDKDALRISWVDQRQSVVGRHVDLPMVVVGSHRVARCVVGNSRLGIIHTGRASQLIERCADRRAAARGRDLPTFSSRGRTDNRARPSGRCPRHTGAASLADRWRLLRFGSVPMYADAGSQSRPRDTFSRSPEPAEGSDPRQSVTGGVLIPSMVAKQRGEPDAGLMQCVSASAPASAVLLAPADPDAVKGGSSCSLSCAPALFPVTGRIPVISSRGIVEGHERYVAPLGNGFGMAAPQRSNPRPGTGAGFEPGPREAFRGAA